MKFLDSMKHMMNYSRVGACFVRPLHIVNKKWSVSTMSQYNNIIIPGFLCPNMVECRSQCSTIESGYKRNGISESSYSNDEQVQHRIKLVVQEMLELDIIEEKRAKSELFKSFVETLVRNKIQKNLVKKHFKHFPEFYKSVSPREWQTVDNVLREFGFESLDIMVKIPKHMPVFKVRKQDLRNTCAQLTSFGLGSKQLVSICGANPRILSISLDRILACLEELHQSFARKDVCTIISMNPRLLTKGTRSISEIVDYIEKDMGLDVKVAVESNVFSRPFLRLKTRHQFLVRCGLWTSNAVTNQDLPSFRAVVDSNDKYVYKKLAGLSREEYETFVKIMEQEEELEEMESESDSDEEVE